MQPDKSGTPSFCDHFIESPTDDPWGGCYCKLMAGHDGPHSMLYPDEMSRATASSRTDLDGGADASSVEDQNLQADPNPSKGLE